jgi:hypothetical protein
MTSRADTVDELMRLAIEAHTLAESTRDRTRAIVLEKAAFDFLERAERAVAERQGSKPILGV